MTIIPVIQTPHNWEKEFVLTADYVQNGVITSCFFHDFKENHLLYCVWAKLDITISHKKRSNNSLVAGFLGTTPAVDVIFVGSLIGGKGL